MIKLLAIAILLIILVSLSGSFVGTLSYNHYRRNLREARKKAHATFSDEDRQNYSMMIQKMPKRPNKLLWKEND